MGAACGSPGCQPWVSMAVLVLLALGCGSPADRSDRPSDAQSTSVIESPDSGDAGVAPTAAGSAGAVPAAEADVDPIFVDAAAEAGLEFTHWNGMSGELYYAEMMGSGAALFDADNDGDLDVYLVQGGLLDDGDGEPTFPAPGPLPLKDRLFRNDLSIGDGGRRRLRFTDVTESSGLASTGYGMGVAAADFDNDGWTDLYVTNLEGNRLFRNRGDAGRIGFEDVTDGSGADVGRWSVPAVAFDYDRDGWLDLFVGNYVEFSAAANIRCSDEIGLPNYCGPLAFAPEPDVLLRNLGASGVLAFADATRRAGIDREYGGCLGAIAADFDTDGWLDLYVANDGMPNQLWMSSGAGGFENRALLAGAAVSGQGHPEASMGVAAADFDADGDEDLFVAHLRRETSTLYVNDGRAQFDDRSAASGLGGPSLAMTTFGTGWLDYDNDGWLDQLTVNGAVKVIKPLSLAGDPFPLHQANQLFRGRGDGSFEDVTARAGRVFELTEVSRGAAFGDLDNDGDTDVVISNNSGPARLLLNQVGQDRAWLGLRLVAGGRDALGARAGLFRDGGAVWRRAGAGGSYASSSDPRLLFGLGNGGAISRVVVEWPDGSSEEWDAGAVTLGAYATLEQGTGRARKKDG